MPTMDVPAQFCLPWTKSYNYSGPGQLHGAWFEQYASERGLKVGDDWVYVPISWAALSPYGGYEPAVQWLAAEMDPDTKYFTIVTPDIGIDAIAPSNLTIVGCSTGEVCIPLISQYTEGLSDLPFIPLAERPHKSNFVGSTARANNAFGVRSRMTEKLPEDTFRHVMQLRKHKPLPFDAYMNVLRGSVYTFAPRGYGPTSFRMYEALAVGSIPIYLWQDVLRLPFADQVDWNELAVVQEADWDGTFPERSAKLGRDFHREFCVPENLCQQIERMFHG